MGVHHSGRELVHTSAANLNSTFYFIAPHGTLVVSIAVKFQKSLFIWKMNPGLLPETHWDDWDESFAWERVKESKISTVMTPP